LILAEFNLCPDPSPPSETQAETSVAEGEVGSIPASDPSGGEAPESPFLNTRSGLAKRMFAVLNDAGLGGKSDEDKAARLAEVSAIIGRTIASSEEMTEADAEAVIATLEIRADVDPFAPLGQRERLMLAMKCSRGRPAPRCSLAKQVTQTAPAPRPARRRGHPAPTATVVEESVCWRSECRSGCCYPHVCSERPAPPPPEPQSAPEDVLTLNGPNGSKPQLTEAQRYYAAFVGATAELARLKAAANKVGHQAACMVDPCSCWMADLAPLLDDESEPECSGLCGEHHWLDRPESDTRECLICGVEVAG
jgi:hypothetical protein